MNIELKNIHFVGWQKEDVVERFTKSLEHLLNNGCTIVSSTCHGYEYVIVYYNKENSKFDFFPSAVATFAKMCKGTENVSQH